MFKFLRRKAWSRTALAAVLAYAFALQTLLVGILSTQIAAASANPFAICSQSQSHDGGDGPADKRIHQACSLACAQLAFSPPRAEVGAAPLLRFAIESTFAAPIQAAIHAERPHDPRSSQGPPQAA